MGEPAPQLSDERDSLERLEQAFLDAFDGKWEPLAAMMRHRLRVRLGDVVAEGPMRTVVHELFEWAEREGRLQELVTEACRYTGHAPLVELATARGWAPGPAGSPAEAAASVRAGLQALTDLLQEGAVRDALTTFRAVFEGADRRIQRVAVLKDLHDRLHDLQFRCYAPLVQASRTFPEETSVRQLKLYAINLRGEIDRIRGIMGSEALAGEDFSWVEDSLEQGRTELARAIDERNGSALGSAIHLLRDVVQTQPTLIDALLLQAVQFLDLPQLVAHLREVSSRLTKLGADASQRGWVEKGAADLGLLNDALTSARQNHRAWQKVDNNIRMFEATLPQSSKDVTQAWEVLQRMIARLWTTDAPWARELQDIGGLLDTAVRADDRSGIVVTFSHFQTLAADRFYQVDKELKQLCDRISPIGRELDAVVQQLQ